jgi:hypothetical protein
MLPYKEKMELIFVLMDEGLHKGYAWQFRRKDEI